MHERNESVVLTQSFDKPLIDETGIAFPKSETRSQIGNAD